METLKSSKLVSRWCAVKPQSEIFAKAVYSVGKFLDVEAEAGHALQIRNYPIQYSFLRDARRTIQAEDIFWGSKIHHTAWKNQWINKLGSIIGDIKNSMRSNPLLRLREHESELDTAFTSQGIQPDNVVLITNQTVEGFRTCPPGLYGFLFTLSISEQHIGVSY